MPCTVGAPVNERLVPRHRARNSLPGLGIHLGRHDVPQGALGARPARLHPAVPVAHRRGPAEQVPAPLIPARAEVSERGQRAGVSGEGPGYAWVSVVVRRACRSRSAPTISKTPMTMNQMPSTVARTFSEDVGVAVTAIPAMRLAAPNRAVCHEPASTSGGEGSVPSWPETMAASLHRGRSWIDAGWAPGPCRHPRWVIGSLGSRWNGARTREHARHVDDTASASAHEMDRRWHLPDGLGRLLSRGTPGAPGR